MPTVVISGLSNTCNFMFAGAFYFTNFLQSTSATSVVAKKCYFKNTIHSIGD